MRKKTHPALTQAVHTKTQERLNSMNENLPPSSGHFFRLERFGDLQS